MPRGLSAGLLYRSAVLLALLGSGGCGGEQPTTPAAADSGSVVAAPPAAVVDGEQIYNRYCFSCHAAGIAGAPKVGVAEAWQPRAAKGRVALLASTLTGIEPGMPVKGLCGNCSEAELTAAIDHMLVRSGVEATD